MTILWSNNASTTVSGSITATGTSVQLAAGTGALFPNPTGGDYFVATFYDQATKTHNEIVHVTAMVGDVATIVRAQEGTVAAAWNAGDILANLVTAGTLRAFVQAGTGPADTSQVYVGIDTSITPGTIICNTNPVPSALAIGMIFDIKVANRNPGPVILQLNGGVGIAAVRTDGSAMIAGNVIAGENYLYMYNGVNFTSTIPPIPLQPPQTTFYIRPDGNDTNSGFANTPTQAFLTIQGAINAIKARYMSLNVITLRVADGTYTSGAGDGTSYIAGWNIIGNDANPAACIVDCRSASSGSYVSGAPVGICFSTSGSCVMDVTGFYMLSAFVCAGGSGGTITLTDCYYTAPTDPTGGLGNVIQASSACTCQLSGTNNQYSSGSNCDAFAWSGMGSTISFGGPASYAQFTMSISGAPSFSAAFAAAVNAGTMVMNTPYVSFPGVVPNCKQYLCEFGGGIWFYFGGTAGFPGNQPGTVTAPGWLNG